MGVNGSIPGAVTQRARQAGRLLRTEGARSLSARVLSRLADRLEPARMRLPIRVDDVLAVDLSAAPTRADLPVPDDGSLTINWVMTPPSAGSGGHTTIFRLVEHLEKVGNRCRVYLYDLHGGDLAAHTLTIRTCWPGVNAEVHHLGPAGMADAHAVFATSWNTAYPVFADPGAGRRFYLVQDFEPSFYPAGSEAALAELTYRFGFHGITAGKWLAAELGERYGMAADSFDFGCDVACYQPQGQRRSGVVFFARPATARRGFELGVLALTLLAREHPEIDIHLFGESVGALPFAATDHGVLTPAALNDLYNRCWAGLVLSLTNVSLVPLELLASGCVPVVNDAHHNRVVLDNAHVGWADPSPRAIANELARIVQAGDTARAAAAASSVVGASWADAGAAAEQAIRRVVGA